MYRYFPHLPFYVKFGAIPESYLVALSYEEQLLWLCKTISDVDEKVGGGFDDLKDYIDNALQQIDETLLNKQNLLTAGDNIYIDSNSVISAIYGTSLTSQISMDYTYGDYNVGQTMPTVRVQFDDTACIEIVEGENPVDYKIKGVFDIYEIDNDTREILSKDSQSYPDSFYDFTTTGGRTLVICWETSNSSPQLYKLQNPTQDIANLQDEVDALELEVAGKQDTLIAGDNITIENNVISATGGSVETDPTRVLADFTSSITDGYTYADTDIGDTLPSSAVAFEDTASIQIVEQGVSIYNVKGDFTLYEIDSSTREVLVKVTGETDYDFTTNGSRTLVVCWETSNNEPYIYKVLTGNYINTTLNTLNTTLASKQDTLTAGTGISIVNNVISATGGGGGVEVTTLTGNVVLSAGSTTTGLTTGFYDTGSYKVYFHSQTLGNEIFGDEMFYYDSSTNTFIGAFQTCYYDLIESDWGLIQNDYLENTLSNARNKVPTSYAVSQALGDKQDTLTAGTGIEINNNIISSTNVHNYSTSEQVVGTWINGKPLYEKVITGTTPNVTTDGTSSSLAIDIIPDTTKVDFAFIVSSFADQGSTGSTWTMPYYSDSMRYIKSSIYYNPNTSSRTKRLQITSNGTAYNNCTYYCVVRYTKASD